MYLNLTNVDIGCARRETQLQIEVKFLQNKIKL